MLLIVSAGIATILGPVFGSTGRGPPPRPFTEKNASLPGKPPADAKALQGKWAFSYMYQDVTIEAGHQDRLMLTLILAFNEDGTYELHYSARWDLPDLDGVNADERGRYSLSGEILLLEPESTHFREVKDNIAIAQQTLASENHVYLISRDKARLHLAGRCAKYQVEPICREHREVWYQLSSQLGRRWLGG